MELIENITLEVNKIADFHDTLDQMEALMKSSDSSINPPLKHIFTPGLYIREIYMPAGSCIVSKIHNTEHPFIISKGTVSVMTEEEEVLITAPHTGITKPGTRRLLFCHTDVVWTTVHACVDGENVDQIEERIIEKRHNPYIDKIIEQIKVKDLLTS